MSYKYYFFDDQEVGAQDLNKLVNLFVSEGLADNFENGVPYNISKLNEVITSNSGDGIVPETSDTLKVSYTNGSVYIEPGVAFFKDGTVIEIETREQLTAPENAEEFYVYLESDPLKNMAYPAVSEVLPEGNIVPLAKISSETVSDLRRFARGKTPSFYASNVGLPVIRKIPITLNSEYFNTGKKITLIDSGNSYRYLILICEKSSRWAGTVVYDKEKNKCYNFSKPDSGDYTDDFTDVATGTHFKILDCYYSTFHFKIHGNLTFEDGKTELEITNGSNIPENSFNSYVFPFNITVLAC